MLDSFGRSINYLRISVTDRCNLRCIYCMPPEGVPQMSHSEILSYEEIQSVVRAAAELGVNKVRLTGGEPLVRADFPHLVKMLSQINGIEELSLTTNGILLKKYALELRQAGLSRVNVSLDTLKADKFRYITRLGELKDVLEGIEAAKEAGLSPVKINTVVMRHMNDDEILDFARMTYREGWHVRFIELMPFKGVAEFIPSIELRQHISLLGKLEPREPMTGNGPALYYSLAQAKGTIGLISPLSELSFCSHCNRVRLTPDGKLRPCLLGEDEIDLKMPLRNNVSMEELKQLILRAVASKPEHHHLKETNDRPVKRKMSQIGG
ncbi:MAG: cyclic pyranopterin phosphate synthase MoaA [Chloroflexi bacterium RBG_13_51_36]|nr:MAG: cyclic pyranopterin phosphate synthase MoaA [Chloroflexi bacterium RBG_13_51_36]